MSENSNLIWKCHCPKTTILQIKTHDVETFATPIPSKRFKNVSTVWVPQRTPHNPKRRKKVSTVWVLLIPMTSKRFSKSWLIRIETHDVETFSKPMTTKPFGTYPYRRNVFHTPTTSKRLRKTHTVETFLIFDLSTRNSSFLPLASMKPTTAKRF